MKKQRSYTPLLGLVVAVVVTSLSVAGIASAAPAVPPIVVKAQDCCDNGVVVVDSVTAAQDGWLGIFKNANGSIGSLVGYVPVVKGQTGSLMVDVNSKRVGLAATLWAGLLVDESGTGIFDPSTVALAPTSPLVAFATAAAPAAVPAAPAAVPAAPVAAAAEAPAGPVANQITIKAQDFSSTGMLLVDSVTAAQDGWLGIFKDPTGSVGALVGYAPVVKGQNTRFTVDVNTQRTSSAVTLWAGLLVDVSGTGVFDVNSVALAPSSPLVAFPVTAAGQ
jgi:hypothetical protein